MKVLAWTGRTCRMAVGRGSAASAGSRPGSGEEEEDAAVAGLEPPGVEGAWGEGGVSGDDV